MNDRLDTSAGGFGLLAFGSSGRWDISVVESSDREEWLLEIDGPQIYLIFQLRDLAVVGKALRFLQAGPGTSSPQGEDVARLTLGRFGTDSVTLVWDNEDFPRFFLVIGSEAKAVLHLSFQDNDIAMFIDALQQVVAELPTDEAE
jgi:hypothetical protein